MFHDTKYLHSQTHRNDMEYLSCKWHAKCFMSPVGIERETRDRARWILYTKGSFIDARDVKQIPIAVESREIEPYQRRWQTCNKSLSLSWNKAQSAPMTDMKQGSILLFSSALIVRWDCRLWFRGLFCQKAFFFLKGKKALGVCKTKCVLLPKSTTCLAKEISPKYTYIYIYI